MKGNALLDAVQWLLQRPKYWWLGAVALVVLAAFVSMACCCGFCQTAKIWTAVAFLGSLILVGPALLAEFMRRPPPGVS